MSSFSGFSDELLLEILSHIVPKHETFVLRHDGWSSVTSPLRSLLLLDRRTSRLTTELLCTRNSFDVAIGRFQQGTSHTPARDHYHTDITFNGDLPWQKVNSLATIPTSSLCSIRRLRLLIEDNMTSRATYRAIRATLRQAVDQLENGQHSLRSLSIEANMLPRFVYDRGDWFCCVESVDDRPMHFLEPMMRLHGIEDVSIQGLNESFNRKLEAALKSPQRIELKRIENVKRHFKKNTGTVEVNDKNFYDPEFDWNSEAVAAVESHL